jgi:hypothetical protein
MRKLIEIAGRRSSLPVVLSEVDEGVLTWRKRGSAYG